MSDLTDIADAMRITALLANSGFDPGKPRNLARENELLQAEVQGLEVNLEDARADIASLRSLLGIIVRSRGGEVILSAEQMKVHPYSSHRLYASAQTVTGELVLRTR